MKKFRFIFILSIVAVLALALTISASAFQFTYNSGFQVQNLSGSAADAVITYYNQDGTVATSVADTIPANGSTTYFPVHAADGFNGSVVISANQPVAAITNILGDGGAAAAAYEGADSGDVSVQLPLLMKGNAGYNTWFNVQNTGPGDASVSVAYSDGTNVGPVTVPEGASHTFDQSTETHSATVFSGVVTSDKAVFASAIEENPSIMFAYSAFTGGSNNPLMPLINANNAGYQTGVQIQNVGGSSTNVTVTYTPSFAGTTCTETQTVAAGASATFALAAFANGANSTCAPGAQFVGSAEVTTNSASQPLTAIVNQLGASNGEAYSGFDFADASDTVVLPLIMDRNSGYYTGFNLLNAGDATDTVNCTFTGTSYTVNGTLAPGEALTALQNNQIANGYVGSGTCTSVGGEEILAVVNELGAAAGADQFLVYNGQNN